MATESQALAQHQLESIVGGFHPTYHFDETFIPLIFRETVTGPFYKGNVAEDFFVSMLSVDDVDMADFSNKYSDLLDGISNRMPGNPLNPNKDLMFSYTLNSRRLTMNQLRGQEYRQLRGLLRDNGEHVLY